MIKILLIEDNLEMRENIAEILELSDYQVFTAENGKIGVEIAKEELPDLIICDIMMPELDGYGVLKLLSRIPTTSSIPFIFLTAKSEKTDFRKGMTLGADDYLTKPFDDLDLIETVELRLKKSQVWKRQAENNGSKLDNFHKEISSIHSLAEIAQNGEVIPVPKKNRLFMEGQYPHEVYFVKSGKIKLSKLNMDGKEYIIDLLGAGDFAGHLAVMEEGKHTETAIVLEDAEVVRIPRSSFVNLVHGNRELTAQFIQLLSNNIKEKEERLLQLAYSSVRQRVADALLLLRDKYHKDESKGFSMNISRDDLANIVGTATESLIRSLSELKTEKIVSIKGSKIQILLPEKLERIATKGF